jgi:Xaa-Pro aminopeptidase
VPDSRSERRRRLAGFLQKNRLDAIAVTHLPNIRYLCGFTGSNALLLVMPTAVVLFTDPRYTIQAGQECDCAVRISRGSLWQEAAKSLRRRHIRTLGVDATHTSHASWTEVAHLLGKGVRLRDAGGEVELLRAVKSPEEIDAIRRSVQLASRAYERTLAKICPGMTEKAIAAEIDHAMRRLGAEGPAFETIVASGPRSALPHARPTLQPAAPGQLLLVDMGASLDGYASDMTRVVYLARNGAPRPSGRIRRLYDAVLEAQLAAIGATRAGVPCRQVDAAARRVLQKYGLGRAFQHSTGHGLGLEIHENPRLGRKVDTALEAGMVVTIEPGAYLEGFGGVRIEDTVLVTPTGAEVLTPTKKDLLVLLS